MFTVGHYIDGRWILEGTLLPVVNPATEEQIGAVHSANDGHVDAAVNAARIALPGWAATPVAERRAALSRLMEIMRAEEAAIIEAHLLEIGTPRALAGHIHFGAAVDCVASCEEILEDFLFEEPCGSGLLVKMPVGVVAAVTPWNIPLHLMMAKVAPALAAGCTIVVKPSELTPRSTAIIAPMLASAGIPSGVFNMVQGLGAEAGHALISHAQIDKVSFTGSMAVGSSVAGVAAKSFKRLHMELGGKSASILLEDADVPKFANLAARQVYMNSGQACVAWSRMLVHRSRYDEAVDVVRATAAQQVIGPPDTEGATMGPLISSQHRDRVRHHIGRAVADGASMIAGGPEAPEHLSKGWYVRPTLFVGVTNDMAIARDEVFGPVLAIIPFDNDDDAVRISEDSSFGLHGAVFGNDQGRALAVARRVRTGQMLVNEGRFNSRAPFGGFRSSGVGRQYGLHGFEEFLELKALHL